MTKPIIEILKRRYWNDFLVKLLAKAVAATTNIIRYWIIVVEFEAQKEFGSTAVNDKLHCNMFTAYFWNGKIAE
jgi:hypothetical protein